MNASSATLMPRLVPPMWRRSGHGLARTKHSPNPLLDPPPLRGRGSPLPPGERGTGRPPLPRNHAEQVLDVLVVPADAAAEEERVVLQGVVIAADQVEVGVEAPAAGQPQVGREILGTV